MSFLGGAECSTASNPLSQFTKHVQDDRSLQRDRLFGRSGLQEGMRSQTMSNGQDKMMDEFMQHHNQMPSSGPPLYAMGMEYARQNAEMAHQGPQRNGSPSWKYDAGFDEQARMEAAFQAPKRASFQRQDFERFQHVQQPGRVRSPIADEQSGFQYRSGLGHELGSMQFRPNFGMGYGMNNMNMGIGMVQHGGGFNAQPEVLANDKGKGRMIELDEKDWEAQFAQLEIQQTEDAERADEEANLAIEKELDSMDRSVLDTADPLGDFETVWRKIQAEIGIDGSKLADEFSQDDEFSLGDYDNFTGFDSSIGSRMPNVGDYLFEEDNLFNATGDPFAEGVQIMDQGGNLSLAALAFEAAVRKDPQHVEAWTRLGAAQAQNEKEVPAIRALKQALEIDPTNLEALMGLAVSYTNEGYDTTAYRTLERWLSVKYPSIAAENPDPALDDPLSAELGITNRQNLHDRVTNLFLRAAQLSPSAEQMDPDVQVGLGVLFYGVEEYEKAVDCFSSALDSTEQGSTNNAQQLPLLWNRLGATLANSGRSEEALEAYENALSLNPNFVRARYNLGVSCINIGCNKEAAQHLLDALAMHKVVEKEGREKAREVLGGAGLGEHELELIIQHNQSTNLYDTLRRVFRTMGRRDMVNKVVTGMDVDAFRQEFNI